jgi:hypothetical protein
MPTIVKMERSKRMNDFIFLLAMFSDGFVSCIENLLAVVLTASVPSVGKLEGIT